MLAEIEQFGFLRMHEDAIEHNKECSKYSADWKKRSIFWDLSYLFFEIGICHIGKAT